MLAFAPPPIFGLGQRRRLRALHPEPRRRRLEAPGGGDAGSSSARAAQGSGVRAGADAVAPERAAALRRRRPREGEGARRAARRALRHARRDARHLLRQRLQQVRPHLAGADVGRARSTASAPTTSATSSARREGRDGAARRARRRPLHVGPRHARPLQQPAGGEALRRGRAGHELRPGDRSRSSGSPTRCCRPTSRSTGAAPPTRRRSRAAPPCIALGLAAIMVFLILAAQYEQWSLPLSVLLALPFGTFGALAAVLAARADERRLLPDRPGDAARPGGEERDPDRRVRRR